MSRDLKPIPRNQSEVTQAELSPPYLNQGRAISETIFSKNRGTDYSVKDDTVKEISIGLEDLDNAILYYFENVIKPTVIQNGQRLAVPVIYGSPERWKAVQNDGFYRDKNGKLMVPIIMFKREGFDKNRTLGNKLDGNKVHNYQVVGTKFNQKNIYDNFSVLTNRTPSEQYYVSVVPDYINVNYSCIIFTDFIEQNNKVVEAIEFASDSYWGDPNRFKFRANIDSFTTTTLLEQGQDRAAKSTFNIKLYGYIISDTINKELANSNIFYSKSQIIFDLETTTLDLDTVNPITQMAANNTVGSTSFIGDGNIITNVTIEGASLADLTYLNTNIVKKADVITVPNQVLFTGASILQPDNASSLPATTINNFVFYINGQYIPSLFTSFVNDGSGVRVQFNTTSIGYTLETGDEVIAIGKFVS